MFPINIMKFFIIGGGVTLVSRQVDFLNSFLSKFDLLWKPPSPNKSHLGLGDTPPPLQIKYGL